MPDLRGFGYDSGCDVQFSFFFLVLEKISLIVKNFLSVDKTASTTDS